MSFEYWCYNCLHIGAHLRESVLWMGYLLTASGEFDKKHTFNRGVASVIADHSVAVDNSCGTICVTEISATATTMHHTRRHHHPRIPTWGVGVVGVRIWLFVGQV